MIDVHYYEFAVEIYVAFMAEIVNDTKQFPG